jgi:hypothetical protein
MEMLWIGLFGLLCAGVAGLIAFCDALTAPPPPSAGASGTAEASCADSPVRGRA